MILVGTKKLVEEEHADKQEQADEGPDERGGWQSPTQGFDGRGGGDVSSPSLGLVEM